MRSGFVKRRMVAWMQGKGMAVIGRGSVACVWHTEMVIVGCLLWELYSWGWTNVHVSRTWAWLSPRERL